MRALRLWATLLLCGVIPLADLACAHTQSLPSCAVRALECPPTLCDTDGIHSHNALPTLCPNQPVPPIIKHAYVQMLISTRSWAVVSRRIALSRRASVCEIKYISHDSILTNGIATINVTETTCGAPIRDHTSPSIVVPAVGLCSLVFVALRIYTRLVVMKEAGLDDWLTILLGVCFCPSLRGLPAKLYQCCIVPVNVGSILRKWNRSTYHSETH